MQRSTPLRRHRGASELSGATGPCTRSSRCPRVSRRPVLLGIDLGTSSVKVGLVDLEGRLLTTTREDYPVSHPRAGWAETDPAQWWSAVVHAVRAATAVAAGRPVAIGLSGQMHGLVATGADLEPVRPAMLWSDSRAIPQLAAYRQLPAHVRWRLRNPLSPGMAGPMLAWLATHEPISLAATRWALQPKDWLRTRLTRQVHAEPSDASATLLYSLTEDRWDPDVLAALGVNGDVLAPLLPASGSAAGHLDDAAAAGLGLPPGLPVAAGAADTAAAALGSGLVAPGHAALTIGSGAQLVAPVETLDRSARVTEPVTHTYRAATDSGWYAMAACLNAGLALTWVRTVLGISWSELYAAAGSEPRPDDPLFLPHLAGERTPYLDPDMRGAWLGLAPQHDRTVLLRAALEGVALSIRQALDALRQDGHPVTQLRLAGGGSTDGGWRQMLADVLGCELRPVDAPAASARGAALLGMRAAGLLDEPALLRLLPAPSEPVVAPRQAASSMYDERRDLFRQRVAALRGRGPAPWSESRDA